MITTTDKLDLTAYDREAGRQCFSLGRTLNGEYASEDFSQIQSLLITGMPTMGKTSFIRSILLDLVCSVRDARFTVYAESPEKYKVFDRIPIQRAKNRTADMLQALAQAEDELHRRSALFAQNAVSSIECYRAIQTTERLPDLYFVIDEYAPLMYASAEAEAFLSRLLPRTHGTGIHLIMSTKEADKAFFPPCITDGFASVASFALLRAASSEMILGGSGAEMLRVPGDYLYREQWHARLCRLRSDYHQDAEIEEKCALLTPID